GSHMCDRLLAEGHSVVALDNFLTGARANLAHLAGHPGFGLVALDITEPFTGGSLGTRRMLELALEKSARFLLTSTSECYGDPLVHPQVETYWGNVNPVGPRPCYDESKR